MSNPRSAQLAQIRRAWRRGAVIVEGPGGIGRSTVIEHLARHSSARLVRGAPGLRAVPGGAAAAAGLVPAERADADLVAHLRAVLAAAPLAVDDAHHLDDVTLGALVATGAPVLLSASTEAPWPRELERLSGTAARVALAPLSRSEIEAAMVQAWGALPDRVGLHDVIAACEGRPGRLAQVLASIDPDEGGRAPRVPRPLGAHPPLVEWALRELGEYRADAWRALRILASQPEAPAAVVAAICGGDAVDELSRERRIRPCGAHAWGVADPLLRHVLADGLAPLHRREDAASLLAAAAPADVPPSTRARWEVAAGREPDVVPLVEAMADAMDAGDLAEAGELARTLESHREPRALMIRSEWLSATGQVDKAIAAARDAATAADPAIAGRGRVLLVDQLLFRRSDPAAAARELAAGGTVDAVSATELAALAALVSDIAGDDGVTVGAEVDRAAPSDRPLAPYAALLRDLGAVLGARLPADAPLAALADSVPVVVRSRARTNATLHALAVGDISGADARAAQHVTAAEAAGRYGDVGLALGVRAMVRQAQGRLTEAREDADEARACLRRDDESGVAGVAQAQLAAICAEQGELERARDELREVSQVHHDVRVKLRAGIARVRVAAVADPVDAERMALDLMRTGASHGNVVWAADVGLHALRVQVTGAVPQGLAELVEDAEGAYMHHVGAFARAVEAGDAGAVRDAGDGFAQCGMARVAADAWLAASRWEDDPAQARRDRVRAGSAVRDLGPPAIDATPPPLTPRERQIAKEAAGNAPSATIADRLGISVRTVDNHLRTVYQKLGVTGRSELVGTLLE